MLFLCSYGTKNIYIIIDTTQTMKPKEQGRVYSSHPSFGEH